MALLNEKEDLLTQTEDCCLICERKTECFKSLSHEELEMFCQTKSTVSYRKGETIIKQGTQFTHVVSFNEGLAKMNVEVGSNQNVMIDILKPSEILGGPGMFEDNRYAFSVIALTPAKICLIDSGTFNKIFRSNDDFSNSFLETFSSRYIQAINRLVSLSQKQMYGRVAEALIHLADNIYGSDTFSMDLSRQELAEFTGMSKESVSRIFKEFKEDGLICISGRSIQLSDKARLMRIYNLC